MTLPPGRARLAMSPSPTGSPTLTMTMGIVPVAFLAATAGGVAACNDDVHLEPDQLGREVGQPVDLPSAHRYSMTMFWPSTHPSSRRPCRNASTMR